MHLQAQGGLVSAPKCYDCGHPVHGSDCPHCAIGCGEAGLRAAWRLDEQLRERPGKFNPEEDS